MLLLHDLYDIELCVHLHGQGPREITSFIVPCDCNIGILKAKDDPYDFPIDLRIGQLEAFDKWRWKSLLSHVMVEVLILEDAPCYGHEGLVCPIVYVATVLHHFVTHLISLDILHTILISLSDCIRLTKSTPHLQRTSNILKTILINILSHNRFNKIGLTNWT